MVWGIRKLSGKHQHSTDSNGPFASNIKYFLTFFPKGRGSAKHNTWFQAYWWKNKRYNFSSLPCTQHLWLPSAPFWSKHRCHSLRIKFKRRNGEKNPELTDAKNLFISVLFSFISGKSNKLLRRKSCNSNHCGFNSAKLQRLASSSHCNGQDSMSLKMTMCF